MPASRSKTKPRTAARERRHVPHEVIAEAAEEWKAGKNAGIDHRTADDVAEDIGVSKSTFYKHANMAGVFRTDGPMASFGARIDRLDLMMETLLLAQGLEVPEPVVAMTKAKSRGVKKRVVRAA